jgi:hypothetical protein
MQTYSVLRVSQPVALATGCRNLEADHIRVGARFQTGETPNTVASVMPELTGYNPARPHAVSRAWHSTWPL